MKVGSQQENLPSRRMQLDLCAPVWTTSTWMICLRVINTGGVEGKQMGLSVCVLPPLVSTGVSCPPTPFPPPTGLPPPKLCITLRLYDLPKSHSQSRKQTAPPPNPPPFFFFMTHQRRSLQRVLLDGDLSCAVQSSVYESPTHGTLLPQCRPSRAQCIFAQVETLRAKANTQTQQQQQQLCKRQAELRWKLARRD